MSTEFYNVKKRKKVQIDDSDIKKTKYQRKTGGGPQVRYAIRAVDEGTNLTKFVSEADWKKLDVPEV